MHHHATEAVAKAGDVEEAARNFADTWYELLVAMPDEYNCEMNCAEANAAADLYRSLGLDDAAAVILAAHAAHDVEGDQHYVGQPSGAVRDG